MKSAIFSCVVLCFLVAHVHSQCLDINGRKRSAGDGSYLGSDGCNTCFCGKGDVEICTKMMCIKGHRRCMSQDGRIHNNGDSFKSADGCNTCGCQDGAIICTERACLNGCFDSVTGKIYTAGQSFPSADGCNTCTCDQNNMIACTEMACLTECRDANGNIRVSGSGTYLGADGCNTCSCGNGGLEICTRMFCMQGHRRCMTQDGRIFNNGDSFKSADGCNTCGCQDGAIMCTERACLSVST